MSSLIERAALRLEQLKNTGVDLEIVGVRPPEGPARATPAERKSKRVDIDIAALASAGFITPASARTAIADEFRIIKRPLIVNAGKPVSAGTPLGGLIMVTSALSEEGKTFTSINLAMSVAAEMDHTVMLVDADVRRSSVMRTLGLPPAPGLMDVLNGSHDLADVLLKTNVEHLTLLPAGTHDEQATEKLASESMRLLLDDIATRYSDRIVIFDSPPLLLTTEARVLASRMGQILFVVRADKTLCIDVEHALTAIEGSRVHLVLNQARTGVLSGSGYRYRYGYGYGYGDAKLDA